MRSHPLPCICLLKYWYWCLELSASGYACDLSIGMLAAVRENGIGQMRHTIMGYHAPHYFVGQVSPLGQCGLLASCQLGPPTAPQKSIQPLRYRKICVAHSHWHSFLWSCHSVAPHCMLLGLYVSHGRDRPLHWCQSYNGSCEIWTDTLLLSSSLLLFLSLSHTALPLSETFWYYFDGFLLLHF